MGENVRVLNTSSRCEMWVLRGPEVLGGVAPEMWGIVVGDQG